MLAGLLSGAYLFSYYSFYEETFELVILFDYVRYYYYMCEVLWWKVRVLMWIFFISVRLTRKD